VVEKRVMVELKAMERLLPVHEAQLIIWMQWSAIHTGLLLNFNTTSLKRGVKRMVR
jgi:GxxExxY protein